MRDQLLQQRRRQHEMDSQAPPVVALEDYFDGNSDEESIAPNQAGHGRPSLAELYAVFRRIQARDDVQAVLVGLHFDWSEAEKDDRRWPAADNVHIYKRASLEEADEWITGLDSDGILEVGRTASILRRLELKPGYRVLTVCWD
jgi:hypothetical protein